jgi:hypothetical protein
MSTRAVAKEALAEAAAARIIAGTDLTETSNVLNMPQLAVVAGAGVDTVVAGPLPFANKSAVVKAFAALSGVFGAGVTTCLVTLQVSEGGGLFTPVASVFAAGPVAAGTAAGLEGNAAIATALTTVPVAPAIPTQWQVIAHPVGGTWTLAANNGQALLVD